MKLVYRSSPQFVYIFFSSRTSSVKINSSFSPHLLTYMVLHKALLLALYCSLFIFFLLNQFFTNIPIFTIIFMPIIYRYIYTSFPSSSDYDLIKMSMFNCKTDTIIFSRPSSLLSITHPFLLSLPTSESITTFGVTLTSHLDHSPHINNMIRTANYFLYNIRKYRYKLNFAKTKCLINSLVFSRFIYLCSLLSNLPVNLMYKLECIQGRSIRVLYKLNFASIVYISDLMRLLGWLKFRYIFIHTCL